MFIGVLINQIIFTGSSESAENKLEPDWQRSMQVLVTSRKLSIEIAANLKARAIKHYYSSDGST